MSQGDIAVQAKPHYHRQRPKFPSRAPIPWAPYSGPSRTVQPALWHTTTLPKRSPRGSYGVLCPSSPDSAASPHPRATAHAVLSPKILFPPLLQTAQAALRRGWPATLQAAASCAPSPLLPTQPLQRGHGSLPGNALLVTSRAPE